MLRVCGTLGELGENGITLETTFALEPEAAAVEARARLNVEHRYIDGTGRWRSPGLVTATVLLALVFGLLPAIPSTASWLHVSLSVSLAVMSGQAAIFILCGVVWRWAPAGVTYRWVSLLDSTYWCVAAASLIVVEGKASSIYWFNLAALVVLMATTVYRHRTYAVILAGCVAGIVVWFAMARQWGDMVLAALVGVSLILFQRLSTITSWRAERSQARAEVIAEEAGRQLAAAERARIRRDLHDSVAGELTAALWATQALDASDDPGVKAVLDRLRAATAELRAVMSAAAPRAMTEAELGVRSRQIATEAARGVQTRVQIELAEPERTLDAELAMHVTRCAQEAVHNACRHSSASLIELNLEVGQTSLVLQVTDDGSGFDSDREYSGRGLANLRTRAAVLDGSITFLPAQGGGTEVTLRCPLGR